MDISNLLNYCQPGPGPNNNNLVWFLILFIILGYGDQGYGCCKKRHHKHHCDNFFFGDGFFALLILALIFLLSKSPCNTTTPC